MSILVTGASGMVGSELKKNLDFIGLTHADLELTDPGSVLKCFTHYHQSELVVHLAAMTDVLLGETQHELFYKVNVLGTRNVAEACRELGIPLMYWSTEYVFDGTKGNYTEFDAPNPLNYYGLTKLLGEYEARRAPQSVVIRTALKPRPFKHAQVPRGVYSTGGYVDDMAREFALAIQNFNCLPPTLNIGLEKKLLTDLARETREIEEIDLSTLAVRLPQDSSLELSTWKRLKKRFNANSRS